MNSLHTRYCGDDYSHECCWLTEPPNSPMVGYLETFARLMGERSVSLDVAGKGLFEVASLDLSGRWFDVSPDGRFLMNASRPETQTQNFGLVVNWPGLSK